MRKTWLAMVAIGLLATTPALAGDLYTFSDYNYIRSHGDILTGFDAGLGYVLSRHFAVEGAWVHTYGYGLTANSATGDFVVRVPIAHKGGIDLFGAAGGEYASGFGEQKFGIRAGGGIEFCIFDRTAIRLGVRYRTAIENGVVANIGVGVSF